MHKVVSTGHKCLAVNTETQLTFEDDEVLLRLSMDVQSWAAVVRQLELHRAVAPVAVVAVDEEAEKVLAKPELRRRSSGDEHASTLTVWREQPKRKNHRRAR
jgi:hypothetical protein